MMPEYEILLGRKGALYVTVAGTDHIALHARPGSGKTSGFVIPNVYAWPGSAVILDIKGEIFEATAGHRAYALGQKVFRFEPTARDMRTHRWNPFDAVDREHINRFDQITRQAFLLFPEKPGDKSNTAQFWEPAARQAMIAVSQMLAEDDLSKPLSIAAVLGIFTRGDFRDFLVRKVTTRRLDADLPNYSRPVVEGLSDFLGTANADMIESIRKSVSTKLQPWYNQRVAEATRVSDFDVRRLRREPMTIYVTISPADIGRMSMVLRLLFDQIINMNSDVTPEQDPTVRVPLLLVLDEFARLGFMESLADTFQFIRGYGVRVLLVVQNKAQLQSIYGNAKMHDIMDNLGVEMVFGTGDLELARELENRMGDSTVMADTRNRRRFFGGINWKQQTVAQHPHRRPVMYDQEILQLPLDRQIILRPGMKPMMTERMQWFTDFNFRDLRQPPPPVPQLDIDIELDDGSIAFPSLRGPGGPHAGHGNGRPPRRVAGKKAPAAVAATNDDFQADTGGTSDQMAVIQSILDPDC